MPPYSEKGYGGRLAVGQFLVQPLTDEEISERLRISVRTARYDIAAILEALDAPNPLVAGLRLRGRIGG